MMELAKQSLYPVQNTHEPGGERKDTVLNRKVLGIISGTTAAGVFWLRRRRRQRRSITRRLRKIGAGTMLMVIGVATRWKGVRSLSKNVGRALIGNSLDLGKARFG
jgi:hypothetical protein